MAENNTNRLVMYLSATVVVLLVAFVAVVIVVSGKGAAPTTPGTTATSPATTTTSTTQAGMAPSTAFDPATATKVPADSDPKKYVAAYYQAILDKKWDTAFKMQPAASQVGQTVADFQATQEQMYGMTSFSVFSSTIGSTDATVVVNQELGANGTWNATWTFVKSGGTWLVKKRVPVPGAATKP